MTRIEPNPYSPYATADAQWRHIFPALDVFGPPRPGALTVAGCERLAVVPNEPLRADAGHPELPDGLCPMCVAAMRGEDLPEDARPESQCRECTGWTHHDALCALCRMQAHEEWVAAGRPEVTR